MLKTNKMKCRIGYNKEQDAYELLLSSDGGESWNMSMSAKCRRCDKNDPDDEPEFIHIGLIEELKKAISLGYEVVY